MKDEKDKDEKISLDDLAKKTQVMSGIAMVVGMGGMVMGEMIREQLYRSYLERLLSFIAFQFSKIPLAGRYIASMILPIVTFFTFLRFRKRGRIPFGNIEELLERTMEGATKLLDDIDEEEI